MPTFGLGNCRAETVFSFTPSAFLGLAHMAVLTHPDHRGQGLGRAVAASTVSRALADGLVPQWRARPAATKSLARSMGFIELGSQLALLPL